MNNLFRAICGHISIGLLLFSYSYAGGNYYIGKDEGGIYLQTDNDSGWYIDSRDLRHFNIGESGIYKTGVDQKGEFILIDVKKFYVDTRHKKSIENEIAVFNEIQKEKFKNMETPVSIDGNRVLVPVTVSYSGKTTEAKLLLDTGASIVTLHRNFADILKINGTQKSTMQLAGGQLISADIARLGYISVGPNKKKDIFVSIIDQMGKKADYDGLLGMNFLRNLRYEIDFEKSVIRWYR